MPAILRQARDYLSTFIDYARTGWHEVRENLNPRKRSRSAQSSPTSSLHPANTPFGMPFDPPLFAAPSSFPLDLQQPPKRRRLSLGDGQPSFEPSFEPPGLALSSPYIQPLSNPFDYRRVSTDLPAALEAPTPPALAFASRGRLSDHVAPLVHAPLLAPMQAAPLDLGLFGHRTVRPRRQSILEPPVRASHTSMAKRHPIFKPRSLPRQSVLRRRSGPVALPKAPVSARGVVSFLTPRSLPTAHRVPMKKRRMDTPAARVLKTNAKASLNKSVFLPGVVARNADLSGAPNEQPVDALAPIGLSTAEDFDLPGKPASFNDLAARAVQVVDAEQFRRKMSRSKMRSSEIRLEIFVTSQQRLQDQKRREDAKRILQGPSVDWRDEVLDVVENPPTTITHWEEVYWKKLDTLEGNWDECADLDAIAERERQISVSNARPRESPSAFAPLTKIALRRLRCAMTDGCNQMEQMAKVDGCVITGEDLRRLKPNCWLNDEIVNAYMALLTARCAAARGNDENHVPNMNGSLFKGSVPDMAPKPSSSDVPNVKIMNSFFFSKLMEYNRMQGRPVYNYARVRRWTRRFDVFSYDMMLIPINQENVHWTLGVINFKDKTVSHLDSMGTGGSPKVHEALLQWLADEAKDKNKTIHIDEWGVKSGSVPIQKNTDDCGVFLCKFADFLCRGWKKFTFSQVHMQYFRSRIAHELLMMKAT